MVGVTVRPVISFFPVTTPAWWTVSDSDMLLSCFLPQWTCVYEFQEGAPTRPLVSPRCSLRLTHYIEEANVGRGYIKELCFSPDGRLICSPYGYGVRLLAFDESCGELADCLPVQTSCLREIRSIYSHSDVVLTTKFSPTHCQLASGCLSGRVALYQPKF